METMEWSVGGKPARVMVGGEGPPLLLLHGGWADATTHWSRVWGPLSARHRVVAPDLPGLGQLEQPGLGTVPAYVEWLVALLDQLQIKQVACVGNSFGATLAWSFAGRHPERCRAVVLVDGVPMPATPAPLLWLGHRWLGRGLMRLLLRRVSFTPEALARAFADPEHVPSKLRSALHQNPRSRQEAFLDCLIAGDGPPAPRVAPLILWGEQDHLPGTTREAGQRLAAGLPGARFCPIARAGHFPQLEQPEQFVNALESWLHEV